MGQINLFIYGKQGCAKCAAAKKKVGFFLDKWGYNGAVQFVYRDLETEDGLAEAMFNDVDMNAIPAIIVENQGRSVARWDGRSPESDELRLCIESAGGAPAH